MGGWPNRSGGRNPDSTPNAWRGFQGQGTRLRVELEEWKSLSRTSTKGLTFSKRIKRYRYTLARRHARGDLETATGQMGTRAVDV